MKKIILLLLSLGSLHAFAQTDSLQVITEISVFQKELNDHYKDPEKSPLEASMLAEFQGHDFFPIDLNYRVNAILTIIQGTPFFEMKTTGPIMSTERVFGKVNFILSGKEFSLPVYQSKDLMNNEEYADYLFFPFSDETNGSETYGGGRYIDLRIPKEGNTLVIDFNKAYNPYCAYSGRYSCPLVPAENQMDIEVKAGVKYKEKDKSNASLVEFDVPPSYPGGLTALSKFINKNLTYPKQAMKQKIHGTVYVSFIVEPDGSITNVNTIKGISPECNSEAERVIRLMPKWNPGQVKGENVAVKFVQPIKFVGRPGWNKKS